MPETIAEQVSGMAVTVTDSANRKVSVIRDDSVNRLAADHNRSVREVFVAAMKGGICPERYLRNHDAISLDEQLTLAGKRVAVVGLGGLGGYVTTLLARVGVGQLVVVDYDVFDETNLNRQVLCDRDSLRRSKCERAASVLGAINPGVDVTFHKVRIDASNAKAILAGSDVVVDDLDNIPDRLLLERAAGNLGVPLVHGAVAGFEGRLLTIYPGDAGFQSLYPGDVEITDPRDRPEAVLGVPGVTPSIIGTLQAMEVLKILLGRGRVFRDIMLTVDLETGRVEEYALEEG